MEQTFTKMHAKFSANKIIFYYPQKFKDLLMTLKTSSFILTKRLNNNIFLVSQANTNV